DVKPDNILFDDEGHVFLSDFGVVKALEHDDHALTQAGTGIGSPKYMAPEQGIGRAVTGTADQYALASTVYEALAGVAPYVADSAVELLMRKDREEAPHLADVVPTVSRESADAVMRALACDPTDRFETCEAFAEAFAAGLDTGDRTPAAGIRAGGGATAGPGRLGPALVLAVAVVFVSMGFGLAWFGNNGKSTEPVVDDSPYRVKLVNPGKEPRRVLRYQRRAGTTETMAVRSDTRILIMSGGEERAFPHAPYSATFKIRVDEVAANGDVLATAEMIGGDVETVTPYEKHADDARNWMKATVGVKGTMRISARGLPSALTWTNRDNVPEAAESTLTGVEASVQELATPLPEEPVGVGAVWDVTHEGELMGIRYTQTTSYELVSLEENGGRVRIAVAQTAPRQEYRSPALPGGRAMLETWFCHGKGEAVFALDRLVSEPAALEVIVDATHTFSIPNLKTPITQPFHVDVKMKVESR
ncbi:MAG: protein kinase, partial [bacterium]|nr:protein kinase [bacterium]